MDPVKRFRQMLEAREVILAPGVYDCVSARLAEAAGFPAVYMSGFAAAGSVLGRPDVGLISGAEMISHARRLTAAVSIPVLADADDGYGNPLNVARTVREYERAGAAGIHIEDQVSPKKCGYLAGRRVIPTGEMVAKIRAALDARANADFAIVARSDSYVEGGLGELIERGQAYAEAGADALFLLGCETEAEYAEIGRAFDLPLLFNIRHYGGAPFVPAGRAVEMGYRVLIAAWSSLAVAAHAVRGFMEELKRTGTIQGFADRMMPLEKFCEAMGLPAIRAMEERYATPSEED